MKIVATSERINSIGGIELIGNLLPRTRLAGLLSPRETGKRSDRISDAGIITSMVGLHAQGRSDYEDIEQFRNEALFKKSLQLWQVPSSVTLRQRLDVLGRDAEVSKKARLGNLNLLRSVSMGKIDTGTRMLIPVDADVSPFDNSGSSKEGVGRTYKGHDGYSPMFCYVGTEGWLLDCELRHGKQHSQKGAPEFFATCMEQLDELGVLPECLFRLDAAHDAKATTELLRNQTNLLIKRNLRHETTDWWLDQAKSMGTAVSPREGKTVYTGTVEHLHPGGDKSCAPLPVVFRVTVRETDHLGEPYLLAKVSVDTWWTTLGEPPEVIIRLYEEHATSEQFHSELKTDMDLERLPSGSFSTNSLLLLCGMIAYNLLRCIDQQMLHNRELMPGRNKVARQRVGSIIRDVIRLGCKLVNHAGKWVIKVWEGNPWLPSIQAAQLTL